MDVQQWISMDFQFFEIQFFEKTMKKQWKNYKKQWKMKTMKNHAFYIICWLAPLGAPAPLATVPTQAQRLRFFHLSCTQVFFVFLQFAYDQPLSSF